MMANSATRAVRILAMCVLAAVVAVGLAPTAATAVNLSPAESPTPFPTPSPTVYATPATVPTQEPTGPTTAPAPAPTQDVVPVSTPTPEPAPAQVHAQEEIISDGVIGAKWQLLGGAAGPLGPATSNVSCEQNLLCVQLFAGGRIYSAPSTGANAVLLTVGKTGPQWHASGQLSAFGYPVGDEQCAGNGCFQRFSSGLDITWNPVGGLQTVWTKGGIGGALFRFYGGYAQAGYPTAPESCGLVSSGCEQKFGNLRIVWSPASGAVGVWTPGAIGAAYARSGAESGWLGYPTSREICGLKAGGCYQMYQRGGIIWSPASGAQTSGGGIRSAWAGSGFENGRFGYPITDVICGQPASGCLQQFQGGVIYWSPETGAHGVIGGIRSLYDSLGGPAGGYLGYPLDSEVCGLSGGGCYQPFQAGLIFWSSVTGAQPVRGGMRAKYQQMGWHLSYLGYPASPEKCINGECAQAFQGGYLTWTPAASLDYRNSECTRLNDGGVKYSSGNASHVTLVYTAAYGQSYAGVAYCKRVAGMYVTEWTTNGFVGASGFKPPGVPSGPTRYNYSPTGSFSVTEAFGLGNPGTALPYRTLNPGSRWGGNPWTSTYNTYFESSSWVGYDENMWYFATRRQHDYRQGAVINYNRPPDSPIIQDAGFAIFLHENKVPTAGCISLDDWAVVDFLQKSTSGDRIIMGVAADIFR
ncbi:hypothetical protein [Arthrobacter sp. AZCC_0090]|uniref:hypothetical protein n=1 Tax=Arthrobacter sp. AZCC_0090 TaxID=2735881 RepID=UPI00289346AF|nr:hypothetical protein [Arthrobacter sp. AZCC_0090]